MPSTVFITRARSCSLCALIAEVPNQASSGVRSQKSDIAATINKVSAAPSMAVRAAARAPVARGTSSIPHAPCSRGMTMVLSREFCIVPMWAAIL